jgi:hypothetical protein
MTTFYSFVPSAVKAPSFMPTLDGSQYTCIITWNVSGQRYYLNCYTINNQLIFSVPIVNSMDPIEIENLEWDEYNSRVVATTVNPHGWNIGQVYLLNIFGARPNIFNGNGFCSIISDTQFIYAMLNDPGHPTWMGVVEHTINLAKGYFQSTIVYRDQRFEVSP